MFEEWRAVMDARPEFWAMRVFNQGRGFLWRNAAACAFYAERGFFASPILSEHATRAWVSAECFRALHLAYEAACCSGDEIMHIMEARSAEGQVTRTRTTILWVYGVREEGIVIIHLQPMIPSALATSSVFDSVLERRA